MSGPALTGDRPDVPGFFGKLPVFSDFVGRRLPRSFLDPWDSWLQQGIVSDEARRIAEGAGMDFVQDYCIAVARAREQVSKLPGR